MINIKNELSFSEFKEIINNSNIPTVVTVKYDIGKIKMNVVMENVLVTTLEDNVLYLESSNDTEFIIHSDSILKITTQGYEPQIDRNIYKIDLKNNMTICISIKDRN